MLRAYDEPDPAAAFFDTIDQEQTFARFALLASATITYRCAKSDSRKREPAPCCGKARTKLTALAA
jgi:hypothetical protein